MELEFRTDDPRYPLVSITEAADCRAELQQTVPRGDGVYAMHFQVSGACPDDALDVAADHDDLDARLVSRFDDGGLFEVLVPEGEEYFVFALSEAGAIPRHMWGDEGVARVVAEVPPGKRTCEVIEHFREEHPAVELVARRQQDYSVPLFSRREFRSAIDDVRREFQSAIDDVLTKRQREVLLASFVAGYFEWPRDKSAAEMAAQLDMAPPTFSQHMRTAQRKVFTLLFRGYSPERSRRTSR